jgi:hypothetical protein
MLKGQVREAMLTEARRVIGQRDQATRRRHELNVDQHTTAAPKQLD